MTFHLYQFVTKLNLTIKIDKSVVNSKHKPIKDCSFKIKKTIKVIDFIQINHLKGVEVEIDFYHSMFHGAAHQINPSLGLKTPNIILEKIVSFIKNNV